MSFQLVKKAMFLIFLTDGSTYAEGIIGSIRILRHRIISKK